MSRGNGSSPAGTPSMDSFRGSCAIFSTPLKSRKVSVSGSWAIRSRAVALSHSRPVRTVSPIITRIGVSLVALWLVGIGVPPSVDCGLGDATVGAAVGARLVGATGSAVGGDGTVAGGTVAPGALVIAVAPVIAAEVAGAPVGAIPL